MAPKKKPKELKRRNNITIKLTDIELELLNQKAEMAGTSKAGYLRNLLIGTPMKVRYEIVADMQDLRELAGEYGKLDRILIRSLSILTLAVNGLWRWRMRSANVFLNCLFCEKKF